MSSEAVLNPDLSATVTGLSQIERVVDAFVSPSKTFKDIQRSASWWLPFVLLSIMTLATAFVTGQQVGFDRAYENKLAQSPRQEDALSKQPPEAQARAKALGATITKVISYSIPAILLISYAVYALILWGSFNFLLGASITYMQAFAVAWYAALPLLVHSLLTILTLYLGVNTESFVQENAVGTNLGYYLPDAAGWLRALLTQLDVISLWSLALAIVGMAIVSKKSVMQSALIVGGLWALTVMLAVAGGAMS